MKAPHLRKLINSCITRDKRMWHISRFCVKLTTALMGFFKHFSRFVSSTRASHTERIWPDDLRTQSSLATFMSTKLESIIILVLQAHFRPVQKHQPNGLCIRCKDEDINSTILRIQWQHSVSLVNLGQITGFHCVFPQPIFQHTVWLPWLQHHITTHRLLRLWGTLRKAVKGSERQHTIVVIVLSCSIKNLPFLVNNTPENIYREEYYLSLGFARLNIFNPFMYERKKTSCLIFHLPRVSSYH